MAAGKQIYQHSPAGRERAAQRALESSISSSRQAQEAIKSAEGNLTGTPQEIVSQRAALNKEKKAQGKIEAEGLREQFRRNPNADTLSRYIARQAQLEPEQAMQGTIQKMQQEIKQRQTRKSFQQRLKEEPLSIGGQVFGNVGALSPDAQKQIAKTYTPAEKRKYIEQQKAAEQKKGGKNGKQS